MSFLISLISLINVLSLKVSLIRHDANCPKPCVGHLVNKNKFLFTANTEVELIQKPWIFLVMLQDWI